MRSILEVGAEQLQKTLRTSLTLISVHDSVLIACTVFFFLRIHLLSEQYMDGIMGLYAEKFWA